MLCISNSSIKHQLFIYTQLNVETVLFQTIQLSISTQFSSNLTLSGATTPGQSGPGSDGNKKLQHYWSLTIRLFSVISRTLVGGVLPLCRDSVGVFYSPSWLDNTITWINNTDITQQVLVCHKNQPTHPVDRIENIMTDTTA